MEGLSFQAPHCALHISSFGEDDSFSGIEIPSGIDSSFLSLLQQHLAFLDIFDVWIMCQDVVDSGDGNTSPHMQSRLLNMPRLGLPSFCCSWFYCHFRNKPQHIKAPREGSFKSPGVELKAAPWFYVWASGAYISYHLFSNIYYLWLCWAE